MRYIAVDLVHNECWVADKGDFKEGDNLYVSKKEYDKVSKKLTLALELITEEAFLEFEPGDFAHTDGENMIMACRLVLEKIKTIDSEVD